MFGVCTTVQLDLGCWLVLGAISCLGLGPASSSLQAGPVSSLRGCWVEAETRWIPSPMSRQHTHCIKQRILTCFVQVAKCNDHTCETIWTSVWIILMIVYYINPLVFWGLFKSARKNCTSVKYLGIWSVDFQTSNNELMELSSVLWM